MFSHVRIVVPLIENSFDIFLNQKLGEKTSRVNNIWSRSDRNTVLKLEDLNPDELKKGLITDPKELVKMGSYQKWPKPSYHASGSTAIPTIAGQWKA